MYFLPIFLLIYICDHFIGSTYELEIFRSMMQFHEVTTSNESSDLKFDEMIELYGEHLNR